MTKKEAFQATYDCWIWLSEHPLRIKKHWFDFYKINYLRNRCAFCEYFFRDNSKFRDVLPKFSCNDCPLISKVGCCECDYSAYAKWDDAKRPKTRTKYASQIADVTKEYMIKEGLWDDR